MHLSHDNKERDSATLYRELYMNLLSFMFGLDRLCSTGIGTICVLFIIQE